MMDTNNTSLSDSLENTSSAMLENAGEYQKVETYSSKPSSKTSGVPSSPRTIPGSTKKKVVRGLVTTLGIMPPRDKSTTTD